MKNIKLELIRPNPDQPRKYFEGIDELAENIKQHGLLTPILVRPIMSRDIFQIVNGERRFRACQLLGLDTIRAEVRDLDDSAAFELSLIENVQRENLTPIEEAEAYKRLLETGLTQAQAGQKLGKSQSYIAGKLRLLDLPPGIMHFIRVGALSEGHAKQLLKLKNIFPDSVPPWLRGQQPGDAEDATTFIGSHLERSRPEAEPPAIYLLANKSWDGETGIVVLDAIAELLNSTDQPLDAWKVCANWWAIVAYLAPLSVAELASLIDGWRDRYYSALVYKDTLTRRWPETAAAKYSRESPENWREVGEKIIKSYPMNGHEEVWFSAAFDDLARCNSHTEEIHPPDAALIHCIKNGFAAPSAMQNWGSLHKRFNKYESAD